MYGLDNRVIAALRGDDRSYAIAEEEFTSFKKTSYSGGTRYSGATRRTAVALSGSWPVRGPVPPGA